MFKKLSNLSQTLTQHQSFCLCERKTLQIFHVEILYLLLSIHSSMRNGRWMGACQCWQLSQNLLKIFLSFWNIKTNGSAARVGNTGGSEDELTD